MLRTLLVSINVNDEIRRSKIKYEGYFTRGHFLFELIMILSSILTSLPGFFVNQILDFLIPNCLWIIFIMSLSHLPMIAMNIYKGQRKGFYFYFTFSWMIIITFPLVIISLIEKQSFYWILVILIIQIALSLFLSMQFKYGSLWFLSSKWRKLDKHYVKCIDEEFELHERLNSQVLSCCYWGNLLTDPFGVYDDDNGIDNLNWENIQYLERLEKEEGIYITLYWHFYLHRYHVKWFKQRKKRSLPWVWGSSFTYNILNFDD